MFKNDWLLRKHLEKFFNGDDLPQVNLVWEYITGIHCLLLKFDNVPFAGVIA
jgi:hypothetical protein